jgi:histidinol phosphatase-like enzyme (inositol monophosphatase family)
MIDDTALAQWLDFAVDAARQAGEVTLRYFQQPLDVMAKSDQSPVTVADRETEATLRRLIGARFPGHAILGEEHGLRPGSEPFRWILDPIDGTRSFVRGVPIYGVLVGLQHEGQCVLGVAHFPALGETVAAARGLGCTWNGRPARTSELDSLSEALVLYTDPHALTPAEHAALGSATRMQRSWGDCWGHILVATGRAEVMLDPRLAVWDCAALYPILREAGGTFTSWRGEPGIEGGSGISTNGPLMEPVLTLLSGLR